MSSGSGESVASAWWSSIAPETADRPPITPAGGRASLVLGSARPDHRQQPAGVPLADGPTGVAHSFAQRLMPRPPAEAGCQVLIHGEGGAQESLPSAQSCGPD